MESGNTTKTKTKLIKKLIKLRKLLLPFKTKTKLKLKCKPGLP